MNPKGFLYEEHEGIGAITLNRPDRLNALTFDIYAELRDFFPMLSQRSQVRCVTITGQGRAFCSGGDVLDIIGPLLAMKKPELLKFTTMTCDLVKNIKQCRKPVIASLNGTICGAGAVIAAAADLRIAAENAKIAFLFVKVGLSGADMGIAQILPRLIGEGRAAELLMTGEFISAEEAYRIGLYNKVVKPEQLAEETRAMARKIAYGPGHGMEITKEAIAKEATMTLDEALRFEANAQADCMLHPDYKEGYLAFREGRQPRFQGS